MSQVQGARVLVIDDDATIGASVAELLEMEGMVTASRLSPDDGLEYLQKYPDTDIVLLDINLGEGRSGVETLPVIKEKYKYAQVIMFTSMDDLEVGVECMKRGATDYLTKPLDTDKFVRTAARALEKKRAERINDLYLGILVHDLKNPLQCIIGAIEFVRETLKGSFTESHHRLFATAQTGVTQIKTIVNNILAISRFENGTFKPSFDMFVVDTAVGRVLELFGEEYASKARTLNVDLPDGDPLTANNDKELYSQVLTNIVSNAVRFTDENGAVTVSCRQTEEAGELLTSITNAGSFIPEHLRAAVFDKFASVQAAGAAIRGQNFGLGLTFCKMAVEAMGGRIWVDSDETPPATTFHFTIPNKN